MFLTRRFYLLLLSVVVITAFGQWLPALYGAGRLLTLLLALAVAADCALLYMKKGIDAHRSLNDRLSNGDDNSVTITVESSYPFAVRVEVIDELPTQFQVRDLTLADRLPACRQTSIANAQRPTLRLQYSLRPTRRGVYSFGHIRVFASTRLRLVERRYTCDSPCDVKVYPSYLMLRHHELAAITPNMLQQGIKRVRRIGNNTEFEQIKDYIAGDDYRTVNWRATARRNQPMVNVYQDERSQQVYSVIDKGRVMQQAFRGMTLLDYAINASLALSFVAMNKEDRAGLLTFDTRADTFVQADRRPGHLKTILEKLYAEQTDFAETDFTALSVAIDRHISKRSLLVIYTNFFGLAALRRQLPFLQQIARRHRLLVVFFEDQELRAFVDAPAHSEEERTQQDVARQFAEEKRLVVATLQQHGIGALLTPPQQLTVNVINRYMSMRR